MSNLEENKRLALDYFASFTPERIEHALSLMSDDATWAAVRGTDSPLNAAVDKATLAAMLEQVLASLPGGINFETTGITAEGDRVALELVGNSQLPDGSMYTNYYHMLVEIRDGEIVAVREYQDTKLADEARADVLTEQ